MSIIRKNSAKLSLSKGQGTEVIIVLAIAVLIAVFAIYMNYSKISSSQKELESEQKGKTSQIIYTMDRCYFLAEDLCAGRIGKDEYPTDKCGPPTVKDCKVMSYGEWIRDFIEKKCKNEGCGGRKCCLGNCKDFLPEDCKYYYEEMGIEECNC